MFIRADALGQDVGFESANGYCYSARAMTEEQGMGAYEIASTQTTAAIAEKAYNILFNATYRITDFGGSLWPVGNGGTYITSMYDEGLGTTVNWNWRAMGCYSYALFVAQYMRGSIGRDNKKTIYTPSQDASVLEEAIRKYADPGELIDFTHRTSEHSISYLASDDEGFYFISDNGDSRDIRLYYATFDYFASKAYGTVYLFDTNNGKDVSSGIAILPPDNNLIVSPDPTPIEPTEPPAESVPTEPAEPTEPSEPITPPAQTPESHAVRQYRGHTYVLYTGAADYDEAEAFAKEAGGYLATVTTKDEQAVIDSLLTDAPCPFAWIGLENSIKGGAYIWTNGEEPVYENYSAAVNETVHQKGFVFTDSLSSGTLTGKWNTCDATYKHQGVLYTEDKFGFIVEYGTPFNDGLVAKHTIRSNDTAYILFDCDVTLAQAKQLCSENGGHLASIADMKEHEILQLLNFPADSSYWLGAESKDGKWSWLDGTALNKDLSLPTAAQGTGLQMRTDAGNAISVSSADTQQLGGFICEIKLHEELYGDVDLDGEIKSADARTILRHTVGICDNCIACEALGDVNHDNTVDSSDARLLLRAAVSLESCNDWGKITLDENNNLFN